MKGSVSSSRSSSRASRPSRRAFSEKDTTVTISSGTLYEGGNMQILKKVPIFIRCLKLYPTMRDPILPPTVIMKDGISTKINMLNFA